MSPDVAGSVQAAMGSKSTRLERNSERRAGAPPTPALVEFTRYNDNITTTVQQGLNRSGAGRGAPAAAGVPSPARRHRAPRRHSASHSLRHNTQSAAVSLAPILPLSLALTLLQPITRTVCCCLPRTHYHPALFRLQLSLFKLTVTNCQLDHRLPMRCYSNFYISNVK